MDGYKGGLGILKAAEVSIELGLNNSGKEKTMLFDSILDQVKKINSAHKDPRVNAIVFLGKGGTEKKVLIRTVSSGSTGYSLDSAWQGDALFFERSDHGEVEISGERYKVVLVGPEEYMKLLSIYPKNKSSGTPDKDVIAQELDQDEFNDYFKSED